ncbi:MAG: thioesterase domain-containing protein, partial [Myxococcota bacterium]
RGVAASQTAVRAPSSVNPDVQMRLPHRMLDDAAAFAARLGLEPGARVVALNSVVADMSGIDWLMLLSAGAYLEVIDVRATTTRDSLVEAIGAAAIVVADAESWRSLLEAPWADGRKVRVLHADGQLTTENLMHLSRAGVEVWRLETGSVFAWSQVVSAEFTAGVTSTLPASTSAWVLDQHRRPTPIGVEGELFVAAASAAKTDAPDTFDAESSESDRDALHGTGQRGRRLADGTIELRRVERNVATEYRERPAGSPPLVGPRDGTELEIALMLEELLKVHPISIHDDFFVLGGNSLVALHLLGRIQTRLDVALPLSVLIESSSVAALAEVIKTRNGAQRASPLVKIQEGDGQRRPFFFVHPVGGNVLCYVDLARMLGADQPVYGLQAQSAEEVDAAAPSIERMAAAYVDAIRAAQPTGPYLIGGLSFGGFVAFEMAQQLIASGERVDMLALLDTWGPHYSDSDAFNQDVIDGQIMFGL